MGEITAAAATLPLFAKIVPLLWTFANSTKRNRQRCKALVDRVQNFSTLLKSQHTGSSAQDKAFMQQLSAALSDAERIMVKIENTGIFGRSIGRDKILRQDLEVAASRVHDCLATLSLGLVDVKADLEELVAELRGQTKKEEAIAVQVKSLVEQGTVDQFLDWLSEQFKIDVETFRKELQESKDTAASMRDRIEQLKSSNQQLEEKLMQEIILSLVDVEIQDIPAEFCCSICLELMLDPVMVTSGQSYCRRCIQQQLEVGNNRCPKSRQEVTHDLFDNIALRAAIARWKESRATEPTAGADAANSLHIEYDVPAILSGLSAANSTEALRKFRLLQVVARAPDGPRSISSSGGIQILTELLDSNTHAERAAAVLQLVTASQSCRMEENLQQVIETKLLELLIKSRRTLRLLVAQILANILEAPDSIDFVLSQPGVITSIQDLAEESEEGRQVSVKLLKILANCQAKPCSDNHALVICLLELSKSREPHLAEESLMAFRRLLSSEAILILTKMNLVPLLVRKAANFSEAAYESSLYILDEVIRHQGGSSVVESGFTSYIPSMVLHYDNHQDVFMLRRVLRVSSECVKLQKKWEFQMDGFSSLVPALLRITSCRNECISEALSLLAELCSKDAEFKELILIEDGVLSRLTELLKSPRSACRKEALRLITGLLSTNLCREEFFQEESIELLARIVHQDEDVDCAASALQALEKLSCGDRDLSNVVLTSLGQRSRSLQRFLEGGQTSKEAAISFVISVVLPQRQLAEEHLELLKIPVQHGSDVPTKLKAGQALMLHASGSGVFEDTGLLSALIQLVSDADQQFRSLLVRFLAGCSSSNAVFSYGGIPVLLQALVNEESRRAVAKTLRRMTESCPACHEALHEARFGSIAVKYLNSTDAATAGDLAASLVAVYGSRSCEATPMVVDNFTGMLRAGNISMKRIAARSLCGFKGVDLGTQLGTPELIKQLLDLVLSEGCLELLRDVIDSNKSQAAVDAIITGNRLSQLIRALQVEDHRVQELSAYILLQLGAHQRLQSLLCGSMASQEALKALLEILLRSPEGETKKNAACLVFNVIHHIPARFRKGVATKLLEALTPFITDVDPTQVSEVHARTMELVLNSISILCSDPEAKVHLASTAPAHLIRVLELDWHRSTTEIRTSALQALMELMTLKKRTQQQVAKMVLASSIKDVALKLETSGECMKLGVQLLLAVLKASENKQQACQALDRQGCVPLIVRLGQSSHCAAGVRMLMDLMHKSDKSRVFPRNEGAAVQYEPR